MSFDFFCFKAFLRMPCCIVSKSHKKTGKGFLKYILRKRIELFLNIPFPFHLPISFLKSKVEFCCSSGLTSHTKTCFCVGGQPGRATKCMLIIHCHNKYDMIVFFLAMHKQRCLQNEREDNSYSYKIEFPHSSVRN